MMSRARSKHSSISIAAVVALFALAFVRSQASADAVVGQPAPEFSGVDSNGNTVKLSDYKGKKVILEWTNDGCPYVGKHYGTGNMQALQKDAKEKGIVWLSVISSAPGRQGHVSPAEANELTTSRDAAPAAVILDEKGTIGHAYGATATPHMYIVDEQGKLVYKGAIDDQPSSNHATVKGARNYVTAALQALAEGKTPDPQATRAYGCSVKYMN